MYKGIIFYYILGFALAAFLGAAILMWLWNAVVVALFALPVITYWQSMGLLWISRMLFKAPSTVTSSTNKKN